VSASVRAVRQRLPAGGDVSAGGRAERTSGATATVQHALLPMVGAAYVRDYGPAVLKLRGAFGTGIRPVRTLARGTSWMGRGVASDTEGLQPEQQTGLEAGADLVLAHGVSLHVTRFDQQATGLIQPVGAMITAVAATGGILEGARERGVRAGWGDIAGGRH
jgi:iron complex outermembrane receptor protein